MKLSGTFVFKKLTIWWLHVLIWEFQTLDLENAYVCFLHVYSYLGNIVKLNIDDVFMFLKLMWGISLF